MIFIFAVASFIFSPEFFTMLKSTKILLFTPFSLFISTLSATIIFAFDARVSMITLSAIISPPRTDFMRAILAFTLPPSKRSISTYSPSKLPICTAIFASLASIRDFAWVCPPIDTLFAFTTAFAATFPSIFTSLASTVMPVPMASLFISRSFTFSVTLVSSPASTEPVVLKEISFTSSSSLISKTPFFS